jgi:hypothetical protein
MINTTTFYVWKCKMFYHTVLALLNVLKYSTEVAHSKIIVCQQGPLFIARHVVPNMCGPALVEPKPIQLKRYWEHIINPKLTMPL